MKESNQMISLLESRFNNKNYIRKNIGWPSIEDALIKHKDIVAVLERMEEFGGEPNAVIYNSQNHSIVFMDCAKESPAGRRSLCYDEDALMARKENKPNGSALGIAKTIGCEILNEEDYKYLQSIDDFDLKTSSWLATPESIRSKGGALFGDKRYDHTFIYHNGVQSYYAARGFRGKIILPLR